MMCEVARQVKMSCGSFTHNLMIMSSDNPLAAEMKIQQASQQLQMIAIATGITGEVEVNPLQAVVDSLEAQIDDLRNTPPTVVEVEKIVEKIVCLLYTSPSPRDRTRSRMPSSA